MTNETQELPIRVYQSDDRLMIAAPMPGLEADAIEISIHENRVVLHGEERGPGQHDRDLLVAEWTIGPYHREFALPEPVDGPRSDATYGNGVLVVSMPKTSGARGTTDRFKLRPISSTRGERAGRRDGKV